MTVEKITTRSEAKRLGLKRYYSGTPCVHGHLAFRETRNFSCVKCKQEKTDFNRSLMRADRRQKLASTLQHCPRCRKDKFQIDFRVTASTKHPKWCVKCRSNYSSYIKNRRTGRYAQMMTRRHLAEKRQTPRWARSRQMDAIYAYARFWRDHGVDCHVDHIVPLRGESVSGLHAANNLRVLASRDNVAKSNDLPPDALDIPSEWQNPVFVSWVERRWI